MGEKKSVALHKLLAAVIGFFAVVSILSGAGALIIIANTPDEARDFYWSTGRLEIVLPLQFIIASLGVAGSVALYRAKKWGRNLLIFVCSFVVVAVIVSEVADFLMKKFAVFESLSLLFIVIVPLVLMIRSLRRLQFTP